MSELSNRFHDDTMIIFLEDDLRLDQEFPTIIASLEDRSDWDHVNLWCPFTTSEKSDVSSYYCGFMMCWGWISRVCVLKEFLETNHESLNYNFRTFIYDYFGLGLLGRQLRLNRRGKLNTWAVYWAIFLINHKKSILGSIEASL